MTPNQETQVMPVLFPNAVERPTTRTPAVRARALESMVESIYEWLGDEAVESDRERIRQQLDEATNWHDDGYELAKDLERDGYVPDARLVEILDGWQGELIGAEDAAVRAWVKETNPQWRFSVGDRIRGKYGSQIIEGEITGGDHLCAVCYVRVDGDKPNTSRIINWEDAEAVQ